MEQSAVETFYKDKERSRLSQLRVAGDLFPTCFGPTGPSSGNTYIKITKKGYWVMGGSYINEISFLQLISLYRRVIRVCADVVLYCRFCGRWMREYCFLFFSEQSVDFNHCN